MRLVILLDLNYTLVANSDEKRQPFLEQIKHERYRTELLQLVRNHTVVLITARPKKYRQATLKSIEEKTGITFEWEIFNDLNLPPPAFKREAFKKWIQPAFPDAMFIAIESNPRTIAEYQKLGVLCLTVAQIEN